MNLIFKFLIIASAILSLSACSEDAKNSSGGTTGGNPLQSSLPAQVSIDAN